MDYELADVEVLCCGHVDYDGSPGAPISEKDCIENYIVEDCDVKECRLGCCYYEDPVFILQNIPEAQCQGEFSNVRGASCTESDGSFIPIIDLGCCCDEDGDKISSKEDCGGNYYSSITDRNVCAEKCSGLKCTDGCQEKKPLFCEDEKLYFDCTGRDGVAGNGNDCGCPPGKTCQDDGRCVTETTPENIENQFSCTLQGYLWCEADQMCVNECDDCESSTVKKADHCVDACEEMVCGENSYCSEGKCLCSQGFYDDLCVLNDLTIDYAGDGCYAKDPCEGQKSKGSIWVIFFIFLILVFGALFVRMKKKEIEKEDHQEEYPNNYNQYYQNYNQNNQQYRYQRNSGRRY